MHLAQLNLARMVAPLDSPALADFVASLAPVNAAAEAAPGFVWRLADETGTGATSIRIIDDDLLLVNMSVWESPEALAAFVYRQRAHAGALRRRRQWFEPAASPMVVLWWVDAGHTPDVSEATERLAHLRIHGSTGFAFPFTLPVPEPAPSLESGQA
jgi:Domain of unknown function (DUF3291)